MQLIPQGGSEKEPVRWVALPTCSRSVSPWEKQLALKNQNEKSFF